MATTRYEATAKITNPNNVAVTFVGTWEAYSITGDVVYNEATSVSVGANTYKNDSLQFELDGDNAYEVKLTGHFEATGYENSSTATANDRNPTSV